MPGGKELCSGPIEARVGGISHPSTHRCGPVRNEEDLYGSPGAVIILLLWLYLAGLVILFGSEMNALIE